MPTTASMRATKKAMVRLVRAPAQMRAQRSWPMALEPQMKPFSPGAMLRYWMPVTGVHGAEVGVYLTGQVGLQNANATTAMRATSSSTATRFLKKARKVLPQ